MMETFLDQFQTESGPALLWAILSPVIGLLLGWAARMHWKSLPGKTSLTLRWYRRLIPLIAPTINILILVIGITFFGKKNLAVEPHFEQMLRVVSLSWFLVAAIHSLTHSRVKTLIAALIAGLFGFLSLSDLLEDVIKHLNEISFNIGKLDVTALQLMKFVASLVLLLWLSNALVHGVEFSLQKMRHLRASTRQLFTEFARIGIYAGAGLFALSTLGIDLTAFAIFGGAVGVGLGFGLQKIASNFISGMILLLERSVEVGDMIEMYNGDVSGLVRHTGARYTLVETFDNREIMIPNEDFISQRVVNWTLSNPRGLIKMPISVAYGSDIELAQKLMLEAAMEHPRCLPDPPATCLLTGFGDIAINFQLNVWLGDIREKRLTTQSEILFSVWRKFTDRGIGLPHQPREAHYKTLGAKKKGAD